MAVIFHHLGLPGFTSGFLGVDIFFVISGYLIGGHLADELQRTGTVSLLQFYERRARRILPALCVMLIVCCLLGYLLLAPEDMQALARALPASLGFYANLHYLFLSRDYFLAQREVMPLLHSWSLAVEGQYYIVLPLFLMAMYKIARRRLAHGLLLLLCLSLAAGEWHLLHRPQDAFFQSSGRLWEFLAGAVAAYYPLRLTSRKQAEIISIGCLLVVLLYIPLAGQGTLGISILPLCIAAALLIETGRTHRTWVYCLLASRPFVGIGLISYSLYLWHWPLLVFFQYVAHRLPNACETALYLCICLLFSVASWRYIEMPFRSRERVSGRLFAALLAVCTLYLLLFAMIGLRSDGFYSRIDEQPLQAERNIDLTYRKENCFVDANFPPSSTGPSTDCARSVPGRENILLWGDSHAAHFYHGLEKSLASRTIHIAQFTVAGCPPIAHYRTPAVASCEALNDEVMTLIAQQHYRLVILSGNWLGNLVPDEASMFEALERTMAEIQSAGSDVLLLGPGMHYTFSPYKLELQTPLYKALRRHVYGSQKPDITDARIFELDERMQTRFGHRYPYVSFVRTLCSGRQCGYKDSHGVLLMLDESHLSSTGSEYVATRIIVPAIDKALSTRYK